MRANYTWVLPRTSIPLGPKTCVMGILNVTPDSFSDGGAYSDLSRAVARALEIEAQGADILDVGGESSLARQVWVEKQKHLSLWRYFRKFEAKDTAGWLNPVLWLALWLHFVVAATRVLVSTSD